MRGGGGGEQRSLPLRRETCSNPTTALPHPLGSNGARVLPGQPQGSQHRSPPEGASSRMEKPCLAPRFPQAGEGSPDSLPYSPCSPPPPSLELSTQTLPFLQNRGAGRHSGGRQGVTGTLGGSWDGTGPGGPPSPSRPFVPLRSPHAPRGRQYDHQSASCLCHLLFIDGRGLQCQG